MGRNMLRSLLGLFAALFSLAAFASFPATPTKQWAMSGGTGLWTSSLNEACLSFKSVGGVAPTTSLTSVTESTNLCRWMTAEGDPYSTSVTTQTTNLCPANSTQSGTTCTCAASYVEEGGTCVLPSVCDAGQGRTFNRTEGWALSSNANADDLVSSSAPLSSLDANDGVCVGSIVRVDRCFRSQEPTSQGLYRLSCDYTMVMTGDAPPGSAVSETNPATPDATCPGFVGQVNGKDVCVGTSGDPLPTPSPAPNLPTSPGNPTAGVKPDSGEGSGSDGPGRTPSGGVGGNSGGPASAAAGRGGTGDRGEDGEDGTAVCGAVPLPPCAVKVDESGVPAEATAAGKFSQAGTDLDAVKTDALDKINAAKEAELPQWSWTFQLPTGCAPYPLEAFGFDVDICEFQPIIHDLMTFLWLSAGVFGLLALFRDSTLH